MHALLQVISHCLLIDCLHLTGGTSVAVKWVEGMSRVKHLDRAFTHTSEYVCSECVRTGSCGMTEAATWCVYTTGSASVFL